jgi:hypothetical protein
MVVTRVQLATVLKLLLTGECPCADGRRSGGAPAVELFRSDFEH